MSDPDKRERDAVARWNRRPDAVVRKFFRDAENLRNSRAPIKCESCMWWNRRKRGVCTAPVPWWVDSDMPGGAKVEEHMPPKTPASFCESYLPNAPDQARVLPSPECSCSALTKACERTIKYLREIGESVRGESTFPSAEYADAMADDLEHAMKPNSPICATHGVKQ